MSPKDRLKNNLHASIAAKQDFLANAAEIEAFNRTVEADHGVIAVGEATSAIQELPIVLAHTLCESVEAAIFFNS